MKSSAKDAALRFLENRDHTCMEVQKRLLQKGYEEGEIHEAIEELKDCGLLDDERYAKSYVSYSLEKGKGQRRVRGELSEKGISKEVIGLALEEGYDPKTEEALALTEAKKLLHKIKTFPLDEEASPSCPALSEKEAGKVARRLSYLGFSAATVYGVLRQLR